jgi:outer membrane lipoprotein SlyB
MTTAMRVRDRPAYRCLGALLAAGMLSLASAMPVHAQYLRIPDFRNSPPPPAPSPRVGEVCDNRGVIRSIREIEGQRPVAVPGAFQNDPVEHGGAGGTVRVGAVVALPMSENPKDQPFVGGVGTPEMRARFSQSTYEITIRLDNGASTVAQRRDGANFRVGDRVRVRGIDLELISP